ncbi:MAG: glycosyltransferase family 4 protein [Desulfobacula sp.]|nr:glycosyltransferase family 4 protein [Desulfobacula sp.]
MNCSDKICIIVATPMTAHAFLRDQVRALSRNFDVTVVANFSEHPGYIIDWDNIKTVDIPIARKVQPIQDVIALFKLTHFFLKNRFSVVHSITPKAGLLGMMASFLACVKIRIHTFTGQVWVTRQGSARWLLKSIDRFLGLLSTHVYADSPSQRDFLVKNKIILFNKIKVLGDGSICGVDLNRFKPDIRIRMQVREVLSLPEDSVVLLFLGRINPDKGVVDLVKAFKLINDNNVHLLMVGPDESCMKNHLMKLAGKCSVRIHFMDFTAEPEKIMTAADILCLPSYREGFGSVVIEAAACGIPSVVSRIYGLTDAVEDGNTGLLHSPGDVCSLVSGLQKLVEDSELRKEMGIKAKIRVKKLFSQDRLTEAILAEYFELTGCNYNHKPLSRNMN